MDAKCIIFLSVFQTSGIRPFFRNIKGRMGQYHAYWCPIPVHRKFNNRHYIEWVILEYFLSHGVNHAFLCRYDFIAKNDAQQWWFQSLIKVNRMQKVQLWNIMNIFNFSLYFSLPFPVQVNEKWQHFAVHCHAIATTAFDVAWDVIFFFKFAVPMNVSNTFLSVIWRQSHKRIQTWFSWW